MTLEYLREFVVIAECGSFDQAADELFITSSALSKHIKKIEAELEVFLFDRSSRSIRLTDAGHLMLPYARKMLAMEEDYLNELRVYSENSQFMLNIASIPHMVAYGISDLIARYQREQPLVQLNISCENNAAIRQKLMSGLCDLAFLRAMPGEEEEDLVSIPFTEDRLCAVCPRNHPLAGRSSVSLSELSSERFLGYHRKTFMDSFVCAACEEAGFTPKFTVISHQFDNQIELAAHGIGIGLVMKKPAASALNDRVVMLDIDPPCTSQVNLYYRKGKKLPLAAQRFVNLVRG